MAPPPSPSGSNASVIAVVAVPVSTTFPNGIALCDVSEVAPDGASLACTTRPHLAADASADDPSARAVAPLPTPAG
jgi:hypothetical protein